MINKLIFIYGGKSDEHDVSIMSFENIFRYASKIRDLEISSIYLSRKEKNFTPASGNRQIYWPIMHGNFGEDGQIQKILERKKIRYIGNSALSSKNSFDKNATSKILNKNRLSLK